MYKKPIPIALATITFPTTIVFFLFSRSISSHNKNLY